jgi:heptosyltransferase-2
LLHHADLFVGTDSGPMNMAAAVGTPTFGLFGVNPPLSYSKFIHPLTPDGRQGPDGMRRISSAGCSMLSGLSGRKGTPQPDGRQAG